MAEKEPASSFCLLGLVHSPDSWAQLQGPFGNRSQHSQQKMTERRSPTLLPGKEHGRVTPERLSASKGLEPGFEIDLSPATFPSHSGRIPPAHTDRSHSRSTGGLFTRTEHVPSGLAVVPLCCSPWRSPRISSQAASLPAQLTVRNEEGAEGHRPHCTQLLFLPARAPVLQRVETTALVP